MKRSSLFITVCFFILQSNAQFKNTINYASYLSKHDLIFDSLSTKWEDGAFLGNGLLGVMVYREDANAIRFVLGRTDVIDHREGINPSIGRARLPIGKFVLRTKGNIQKINLRLDLWNAELRGSIITDKGTIQLQTFVAAKNDVIIINRTNNTKGSLSEIEWKPEPAVSPFITIGRDSAHKYPANPPAKQTKHQGINFHFQGLLAKGGHTTAWKNINLGNKESLIITIANSNLPGNKKTIQGNLNKSIGWSETDPSIAMAYAELDKIKQTNYQQVLGNHRKYWHEFYQRSFISIPDKRLESFWWIQQYKMASATRVGALAIDLMGPWFYLSPWPKYWWNLNTQLTYYPFFSSNHIDLAKPLLKMVDDNLPNLVKNTPEQYQHNSAALARSGPYDMHSPIRVLKGNDSTISPAPHELGNLTWLLHVYWQAYEHTMDKQYMRSIYPVLTKAINYYLNIIDTTADGKYHLPYTYSPEYPRGVTRDANYDLASLRWGAKTLLQINDELKLNDPLAPRWSDVLENLTPYPADKLGFRIGRDADFSISHRHYSHLLMIYPYYEINWDQVENRDLIQRSLNQWKSKNDAWRGYSYTGSGSIHAMMGEGDSTWKMLNEMMKGRFSIKANTMYLEAGPVIETPLSAATTINEMLLQSWNGVIRVFPAIPDSWEDVAFDKLLAKGAFEVSAVRKNGETSFIRIKSLAGQPCLVKTGWSAGVRATGKRIFKITNLSDGNISVDLKKGEEVILFTGSKPASFNVTEGKSDNKLNYWGLNK